MHSASVRFLHQEAVASIFDDTAENFALISPRVGTLKVYFRVADVRVSYSHKSLQPHT